ncbi:hypothetical protein PybrP1_004990 [[Pythium] brassicae (nom. inval.)]|nr:hypothetical protein PybrP1_004990 [[Pythium] brassicae (nom. inval.)]
MEKRVLRYVQATENHALMFAVTEGKDVSVQCPTGADVATDKYGTKSISGYEAILDGNGTKYLMWMVGLLDELQWMHLTPGLFSDNIGRIYLAAKPGKYRNMYFDSKYHLVRHQWKLRLAELREMLPSTITVSVNSPAPASSSSSSSYQQRPTGGECPILEAADSPAPASQPPPLVAFAPQTASSRFFTHVGQSDEALATNEGRLDELRAYHRSHYAWRFYRTLCQFRFGYFAFLVLMVIVMFSFTMLMEFFFAIFLPSAKYDEYYVARSIGLLVALPVALFFLSYFFEEASRLFLDAIDKADGSLPNFRLALAVVIHYLRHRKEMPDPRAAAAARASRRSSHGSVAGASGDDEGGGGGGKRGLRASLLMTAEDDPFMDVGKEEEDLEWERREEMNEQAEAEAATAQLTAPATTTSTVNRWRRVKAAVTATLLIRKVEHEAPEIDVSTFVIVDIFCPVLFEIATLLALVLELLVSWSPSKAFLAYVQMGFWSLSVYLLVWVGAHFWSSRNRKMRLMVSTYRRRRRTLRRAVNELDHHKRSEHLWLLDVGFRFYYHVGQKVNLAKWWRARRDKKKRSKSADDVAAAALQTDGTVQMDDLSIHISSDTVAGAGHPRQPVALLGVATTMRAAVEVRARMRSKNPWHRFSYTKKAVILLVLVIASALLSLYSFLVGWPIMGVCLIALGTVIQKRFPQIFGRAFRHFIAAFVVLSLVFFSSTFLIGTFVSGGNFKLGPFMNGTEVTLVQTVSNAAARPVGLTLGFQQSAEYPACSIDYDGLTVLDLALIADAAYGNTTEVHKRSIDNRFNGTALGNWTYVTRNDETKDHQVWMELYFAELNMTVIAVRGTASAADALEDLHYWFGITIMQAVDVFVPFLKQLPHAFVVKLLSMDLITSVMPEPVYVPLVQHVEKVRARVGDNVVLTGHSLGGAMAAMVGAKTQTRAVSFSGPGLLYSRGRFGIDASDIRDNVLTFKPRKDIVPRVDELGGMVQELRCKQKSPMGCHSSFTHICELFLSCGDTRSRNWAANEQCLSYQALPEVDEDSE